MNIISSDSFMLLSLDLHWIDQNHIWIENKSLSRVIQSEVLLLNLNKFQAPFILRKNHGVLTRRNIRKSGSTKVELRFKPIRKLDFDL